MKNIIVLVLFYLCQSAFAQSAYDSVISNITNVVEPKFNGEKLDKFLELINKEFNFSKIKKSEKIVLPFSIEPDGKLNNLRIVLFQDPVIATEVCSFFEKPIVWTPIFINEVPFQTWISYTIYFEGKTVFGQSSYQYNKNSNSKASLSSDEESKISNEEVFEDLSKLDSKPVFPGGIKVFYHYFGNNFIVPVSKEDVEGVMLISFMVNAQGKLSDFKIIRDICNGCGNEAVRVLESCPLWIPGYKNGLPVKCLFSMPIKIAKSN